MLGSTATKREAKAYLSRFNLQKPTNREIRRTQSNVKDAGVNLGNLYLPIRAVEHSLVFSTAHDQSRYPYDLNPSLHVALVKIRAPQTLDDATLHGVAHTLSQLTQLGMTCAAVIDPTATNGTHYPDLVVAIYEQADRVVEAIESYNGQRARRLDSVVGVDATEKRALPSVQLRGSVKIIDRELLTAPLSRAVIPVILPLGYDAEVQKFIPVDANEVVLALTRDFAGLHANTQAANQDYNEATLFTAPQRQISLDRIIILDPLGGIPSSDSSASAHVFINLEQEFDTVKSDLMSFKIESLQEDAPGLTPLEEHNSIDLPSKPSSPRLETVRANPLDDKTSELLKGSNTYLRHTNLGLHVQNLNLVRDALALLPPSSSALLTTSEAVADSQSRPPLASQGPRVRTRRQRNPLIHNLLTDKPVSSSSLPSTRLRNLGAPRQLPAVSPSPATFFKRGMPVTIYPDPLQKPWAAPTKSNPSIKLFDPRIDLSRLVHLIEDSFNRKLDVSHYLERVKDRIAGVIIAGEYEGGAILTWETPPGVPTNGPQRMVPYLDKFAVLKRSQGAGGVADIMFKAMVRECFPKGVCWRSRKDNPVNKWYFERARGTWNIPKSNWTMFWTAKGVELSGNVFSDYEEVCRTVEPSWVDRSVIE